ncbi:MAG TPA: hypothetical protein DDZ88_00015 [Verrucomicrobiales bacterium]|nr:hypothetical protein [Verrucomicrobiales bacterium]
MLTLSLLVLILGLVIALFRFTRAQRKKLEGKITELKILMDDLRMTESSLKSRMLTGSEGVGSLKDMVSITVALLQQRGVRIFKNTLPERIGHLALETDLWLKELALNGADRTNCGFIVSPDSVANAHLLSYWSEQFSFTIPVPKWDALAEHFPEIKSLMSIRHDYGVAYLETASLYDLYKQWGDRPPILKLRDEDRTHGAEIMRGWGIGEGDWFVCFHNREPGYAPHDDKFHTYRNAPIESLIPAMKEVIARGGWVVRMGDPAMTPLPNMARVIDYAHSPQRSARMDVILCATSKCFIGNTSGLFIVSTIFGVPVASVNFAPMSAMQYTARDIAIPKLLYSDKKKRLLSFQEVMESPLANLRYTSQFESEGVRVVDNTEDEITGVVIEMLERGAGPHIYTSEDERLQKCFRALLKPGHYGYGSAARIGRDFLRKHQKLLLDS